MEQLQSMVFGLWTSIFHVSTPSKGMEVVSQIQHHSKKISMLLYHTGSWTLSAKVDVQVTEVANVKVRCIAFRPGGWNGQSKRFNTPRGW